VNPLHCRSPLDSCGPSGRRTSADLFVCPYGAPDAAGQCCFPAAAEAAATHSSAGRTSSSSGAAQSLASAAAGHPAVAEPASAAEAAAKAGSAVPAPAAVVDRLAGSTCFCGDAGDAGALATVPAHWLGPAPFLVGALSVLLSCVHFLALCCLLPYYSVGQQLRIWGAELPSLRHVASIPWSRFSCEPVIFERCRTDTTRNQILGALDRESKFPGRLNGGYVPFLPSARRRSFCSLGKPLAVRIPAKNDAY